MPGAIVAVAEDRHLAGVVAERRLGATVHVLDDGFQHVQLARDLDVLLTSAGRNRRTAASCRSAGCAKVADAAAARAIVVVVLDADAAERADRGVGARHQPECGRAARSDAQVWSEVPSVRSAPVVPRVRGCQSVVRVCAVGGHCAIRSSSSTCLRDAGYRGRADDRVSRIIIATAHGDIARDRGRGARRPARRRIVTTEKDAVRFERARPRCRSACVAVPMRLELDGWDVLAGAIDAALARAREAA